MMPTALHWLTPMLCCTLGMLLALPLLAVATPRRWWQRPSMGNGLLLLGTCALLAWLLSQLAQTGRNNTAAALDGPQVASRPSASVAASNSAAGNQDVQDTPPAASSSAAGWYRVHQALHLRSGASTSSRVVRLLPAGSWVWRSGEQQAAQDGDWWLVCQDGQRGWASSLWLRRADEGAAASASALQARQLQADKCEISNP